MAFKLPSCCNRADSLRLPCSGRLQAGNRCRSFYCNFYSVQYYIHNGLLQHCRGMVEHYYFFWLCYLISFLYGETKTKN